VLDESAGGFAVLVDRHPGVEADTVVRLCTDSGWHEVRVVRICEHEPATRDGEAGGENVERRFRIGLERLRDLAPWEANRGFRVWFDRLRIGGFLPLGSGTVAMAVMVVLALTVGLTTGALVLGYSGRTVGVSSEPSPRRDENSAQAFSRSPSQSGNSPLQRPNEALGSNSSGKRAGPDAMLGSLGGQSSVAATIHGLPGASPFALKEVARELGLSESQQKEVGRIIQVSDEAIRQIRVRWPDQTRQQHAEKRRILLDEARRRVLQLLTKEQRARWEALQAGTND
jgi:hypothetical protein